MPQVMTNTKEFQKQMLFYSMSMLIVDFPPNQMYQTRRQKDEQDLNRYEDNASVISNIALIISSALDDEIVMILP